MKIPISYTIRLLEKNEWKQIEEIYESEFGNKMPENTDRNWFLGVFDDGELVGFLHTERILHLNAVYLEREHRNRGIVAAIFQTLDESVLPDSSMIIMPDKEMGANCRRFGFRSLGKVDIYRKDY